MRYHSKLIKEICDMDDLNIEINSKNLSRRMGTSEEVSETDLQSLINNGYLINTSKSFIDPHSNKTVSIRGNYILTDKARDFKSTNRENVLLKWYPHIISTIALIVSIVALIQSLKQ